MSGRFFPGFSGPLLWFFLFLLSSTGTGMAQQAAAEPDAHERGLLAQTFVNERLAVWQQRLNLQDWRINVVMSHPSELKPRTLGNIHWDADKRSAVIRVLDASDYNMTFRDMLDDMEFTVVHELIHLELSSLPRSEASRRDEEHAVNQIAEALLKLDRKR
ncbi:MAG: hypothetical protein C5B51_22900 [Terriglobia bacterium]|nr:MAG: hypothetical protein C5B51_22900 [Terriglobia bacterium]